MKRRAAAARIKSTASASAPPTISLGLMAVLEGSPSRLVQPKPDLGLEIWRAGAVRVVEVALDGGPAGHRAGVARRPAREENPVGLAQRFIRPAVERHREAPRRDELDSD